MTNSFREMIENTSDSARDDALQSLRKMLSGASASPDYRRMDPISHEINSLHSSLKFQIIPQDGVLRDFSEFDGYLQQLRDFSLEREFYYDQKKISATEKLEFGLRNIDQLFEIEEVIHRTATGIVKEEEHLEETEANRYERAMLRLGVENLLQRRIKSLICIDSMRHSCGPVHKLVQQHIHFLYSGTHGVYKDTGGVLKDEQVNEIITRAIQPLQSIRNELFLTGDISHVSSYVSTFEEFFTPEAFQAAIAGKTGADNDWDFYLQRASELLSEIEATTFLQVS